MENREVAGITIQLALEEVCRRTGGAGASRSERSCDGFPAPPMGSHAGGAVRPGLTAVRLGVNNAATRD